MWYNAGTITVAAGSVDVVGNGTAFVGNVDTSHALIAPDGRIYEIAQVVSATALKLVRPYAGGGAANVAYDILPTQVNLADMTIRLDALLGTFRVVRDTIGQGMFADGTVASPGLRFTADQDTGFYRNAANTLVWSTGGVARMWYDGTYGYMPTPISNSASNGASLTLRRSDAGAANLMLTTNFPGGSEVAFNSGINGVSNDGFAISLNGTPRLVIDGAGNIGVGTASPQGRLHVLGTNTTLRLESSNANATDTQIAIVTTSRQWNIGQNVGATGVGTLNIYDVSAGALRLSFETNGSIRPGVDNAQSFGSSVFRWSVLYAGTGSINTSDQREKKDIGDLPVEWLDAWGDVQWARFRFRDAVKAKGEDARWHLGLIAQQVRDAFAARGLDASEIGLLCHDEWEATPAVKEVRDEDGEIVTQAQPARKAGDRWGLRYDECQAIEAAWQRRRISVLEAAVEALTKNG